MCSTAPPDSRLVRGIHRNDVMSSLPGLPDVFRAPLACFQQGMSVILEAGF